MDFECTNKLDLDITVPKKKINEVRFWLSQHFVESDRTDYSKRCPFLILQGPTGCGKTKTLTQISKDLNITIREYSETTDITAISYNLGQALARSDESIEVNRRKALKFQQFVITSLQYNILPSGPEEDDDAAAEFDTDDICPAIVTGTTPGPPPPSGVIIHIESPPSFFRIRRIFIQTLYKLMDIIKKISKHLTRRIAIVFETLEGECEYNLPAKLRTALGIDVIKFNPVTRANMRKFIECLMQQSDCFVLDRETIDIVVNDCDGDVGACINTLRLLYNRPEGIHQASESYDRIIRRKRQKMDCQTKRLLRLDTGLLRDSTKSLGFFHALGKIFYQKRLYPSQIKPRRHYRSFDRPFVTENTNEYLVDMLNVKPDLLMSWLHHHYYKFCGIYNIEKAALFLEYISEADIVSLNSLQSTQFYETNTVIDQIQTHLAVASTIFSLYENQSSTTKASHKKLDHNGETWIVKSSVENASGSHELYSFNKPSVMALTKLTESYRTMLSLCTSNVMKSARADMTSMLVDYIPYINRIGAKNDTSHKYISILDFSLDSPLDVDYDSRHERLLEAIEELETTPQLAKSSQSQDN